MGAPDRTEVKEAGKGDSVYEDGFTNLSTHGEGRNGMPAVARAIDVLAQGLTEIAQALSCDSQRERAHGHWLVAAILDRSAEYLTTPVQSFDDLIQNLQSVSELSDWLPSAPKFEDVPHYKRKVHLLHSIFTEGFDPEMQDQLLRITQRPGRPNDVRPTAAYALELHEQGKAWPDIEQVLLPHRRRHATGEAIRRTAQRLKTILSQHDIPAKPS